MRRTSQSARLRAGSIGLIALALGAAAGPKAGSPMGHSGQSADLILVADGLSGGSAWSLTDGSRNRLVENPKGQSKQALLNSSAAVLSLDRDRHVDASPRSSPPRNASNLDTPSRAPPFNC